MSKPIHACATYTETLRRLRETAGDQVPVATGRRAVGSGITDTSAAPPGEVMRWFASYAGCPGRANS